jgi:hypothetical protein
VLGLTGLNITFGKGPLGARAEESQIEIAARIEVSAGP